MLDALWDPRRHEPLLTWQDPLGALGTYMTAGLEHSLVVSV